MSDRGLLSIVEAQRRIIESMPLLAAEQVSVAEAFGRTLANTLVSRRNQPPTAVSAMDGYAVRSEDLSILPVELDVVGSAPAGHPFDGVVGQNEAVRIFTGGTVPTGADAIVIQENTKQLGQKVRVTMGTASVGKYIRPAGLDFMIGDELLPSGQTLTARDVGLAAAMNLPWLHVRRKPRIAILATGDEIVMPGDPIGRNQIVSSNALSLASLIKAHGGHPLDLGIAPDDTDELITSARGAIGSDILVTTGGASVGDHDLVQTALGDIGLKIDFWRIAMRPGKPLMFGRIENTFLIGLPGNPVSSTVCAIVFVIPAIRKMLGIEPAVPKRFSANLAHNLPENDEREDYLRATLTPNKDGTLFVKAHPVQDSSMYATIARSDALIVRPPHAPTAHTGEVVEIIKLQGSHFNI